MGEKNSHEILFNISTFIPLMKPISTCGAEDGPPDSLIMNKACNSIIVKIQKVILFHYEESVAKIII